MKSGANSSTGRVLVRYAWVALAVICFLLPVYGATPAEAAATGISMRASVGFQNYFDPRVWVPIRVTLTESVMKPLAGTLVYEIGNQYPFEGKLRWPVTFSNSDSATVTVGIPGRLLERGGRLNLSVNGKTVASTRLVGVAVASSDVAAIVSDRPQTVQFLAGVAPDGASPLVAAYVPPEALPSSPELLQGLTYLYLDGYAAEELSSKQARAVLTWVRAGGILILGGIQPNAGQLGSFASVSPIQGQVVLDQTGRVLGNFSGTPTPKGVMALLYGSANPGAHVLVGTNSKALLGARMLGRGAVLYVGFNAAASTLVSWSGNAIMWDALLHGLRSDILPSVTDMFGQNGGWSLMSAAELFPQLHAPPLWIWEIVFGVYAFSMGPVVYFVLRRRRKNEWAWVVLPFTSLLVAAAIYGVGVFQRPNGILTQSVGVVDIVDGKLAEAVGVEALMSPQTRSYSVASPLGTWAAPLAERVSGTARDAEVAFGSAQDITTFTNVRAWGGRFTYAVRMVRHFGSISGELFLSNKSLAGYLVNDTSVGFSDVALVADGQVVRVGPLARGKSVRVEALLRGAASRSAFTAELSSALPSASHGVGRALFDYVRRFSVAHTPPGTALVIAWSHGRPRLFSTPGPVLAAAPQWIVRQLVPIVTVVE